MDGYTFAEAERAKVLSEPPFIKDSHEMNFKKVPKTKTTFFDADCFQHNFWLSFYEENSKIKFLLTSLKPLTNCENPSSNSILGACSGIPIAGCDL
jgi:hypothetical protein